MQKAEDRKLKIHLLRGWLLDVLSLRDWTAYEWAKRADIHASIVQRAVVEEPKSLLKDDARELLARVAGVRPPVLDTELERAAVIDLGTDAITTMPARRQANDLDPAAFGLPTSTPVDGTVQIPEYDVRLSAGGGSLIESNDIKARWGFSKDYVTRELRANATSLNMVEVVGDSMEPKLQPGDRIIVNQDDTNPTPPGIFALWDGFGLVVKKVQRIHKSDPERFLLISENPTYPPYEVMLDEIKIIGRVVSCIRKM